MDRLTTAGFDERNYGVKQSLFLWLMVPLRRRNHRAHPLAPAPTGDSGNVWFENGTMKCYHKKLRGPEMQYIDYGLSAFQSAGGLSQAVVGEIHQTMCRQWPFDRAGVCYEPGGKQPECRKPRPVMLRRAASALNIDLTRSFMVGDRWRDIDCGHAARMHDNFYKLRP